MSWRSEPVSPAQLIATKKPPVVQVTRTDSSKVILEDPEVAGDTLYGRPQSHSKTSRPIEPESRWQVSRASPLATPILEKPRFWSLESASSRLPLFVPPIHLAAVRRKTLPPMLSGQIASIASALSAPGREDYTVVSAMSLGARAQNIAIRKADRE
jgi:hypothetical protein